MFKSIEDFHKFSKDQLEAATKSAAAVSTGMQSLSAESADFARKSFETGSDAFKKLAGSRSVESAVRVQLDYAKTAFDSVVAESGKLGGMMAAAAQDAFKPIESAFAEAQSAMRASASA